MVRMHILNIDTKIQNYICQTHIKMASEYIGKMTVIVTAEYLFYTIIIQTINSKCNSCSRVPILYCPYNNSFRSYNLKEITNLPICWDFT
jgi:hypothetical protein